MGTAADLLRMLEPVVRPGNLVGRAPASPSPQEPIEARSFESLLDEARQMNTGAADQAGDTEATPRPADSLAPLAQIDRVENASLRTLISRANRSSS